MRNGNLRVELAPLRADKKHTEASGATPGPEFYTWENLPSLELVKLCIGAYYSARGLAHVLCPIPDYEAFRMLDIIYETPEDHVFIANRGVRLRNNYRICQLLLMAAVGAQYLEDEKPGLNTARASLFASGRWYLDVAFGKGPDDLERMRANVLAGLYLIFEKKIVAIEYLSMWP